MDCPKTEEYNRIANKLSFNEITRKEREAKTEFINLTDMWQDGNYGAVGDCIRKENWELYRVAEFCAYFSKNLGLNELNLLHKFL